MERHTTSTPMVIDCGVSLDVTQAERLCERMKQCLEARRPVVIDSRSVQRLDFVGVHLLATFLAEAAERGMPVYWPELGRCLSDLQALLQTRQQLPSDAALPQQ